MNSTERLEKVNIDKLVPPIAAYQVIKLFNFQLIY
jgi:hypothetical protein